MTGQQLKNSILQMAVQGKLVPQDPNDEPASVLLERIRKEKEQLIKDGKIKKEKNLSYIFRGADNLPYEKVGKNEPVCIADEVPFEIPESWEWVRLSNIFSIINGDRGKNYPAKSTLSKKGIPFISALNLNGKTVIEDDNLLCLSDEQFNKLGNGKLIKDDVVVCIRGSLGKHGRYPFEKGAIASSLVILRPHLNISQLSDFIMMYLDSPVFFSEILKYDNGTAQPNLAAKSIEMFFVPLPPLKEQEKILKKIEAVNSFINRYKAISSKLTLLNDKFPDALKKSILQEAIQGKLVPQDPADEPASVLLERIRAEKERLVQEGKIKRDKHESVIYRRDNSHYEKLDGIERCIDDEIPFEIPKTWKWTRLGQVISLLSGTDFKPEEYNDKCKGIPYITGASSLSENGVLINRWTETPKIIANYGDVLLVCKGSGYGKTVICDIERAHIARQIMAIKNVATLYMLYIRLFLQASFEYIKSKGQGVIPGIDRNSVMNMLFPIPPLAEQKRIVEKQRELFDKISLI